MLQVSGNDAESWEKEVLNARNIPCVQEQHGAFEYLEKINWANNQNFCIGGVCHMFKGQINSIMLATELLKNYVEDLNGQFDELNYEPERLSVGRLEDGISILGCMPQIVQGINGSARKLSQFLSHLSEFNGKVAVADSNNVDPNRLIPLCASIIHHQQSEYTSRFHMDLEPGLPMLSGNAQQISQVILNLLINALRSLPDRSREISLSASYSHTAGCVQICVRDEGIGISSEIFPRVLEPFFTTWAEEGCMGIGLTVTAKIIRNLGGTMSIDSESGKGTRVLLSLPVRDRADAFVPEGHHA